MFILSELLMAYSIAITQNQKAPEISQNINKDQLSKTDFQSPLFRGMTM
jgi:hypothetical protein